MSEPAAIRFVARAALDQLEELTIQDRITLYVGLSEILPDEAERTAALNLALLLKNAADQQLTFANMLGGDRRDAA